MAMGRVVGRNQAPARRPWERRDEGNPPRSPHPGKPPSTEGSKSQRATTMGLPVSGCSSTSVSAS